MPFFSICIPQYNRTSFLMEACRYLKRQTRQDFEVCISDDCSTDGRAGELQQLLRQLQIAFVYRRQPKNSRYDANLRGAIALASGEYCLVMGNDDCLAEDTTLESLRTSLRNHPKPGVAITTNYAVLPTFRGSEALTLLWAVGCTWASSATYSLCP